MRIAALIAVGLLAAACASTGPTLPSSIKSFPAGRLSGPLKSYSSYHLVDTRLRRCFLLVDKGASKAMVQISCRKLAAQNPQAGKLITWPMPRRWPRVTNAIVPDDGPRKGSVVAPVTIVTFSDLQCPFCARVNHTLKRLLDEFDGKVAIVFRHMPLSFHRQAFLAAKATLAAHNQGFFWPYHDKVFENYRRLSREVLIDFARELGLQVGRFIRDLDAKETDAAVRRDMKLARKLGVSGTPSFFINGKRLVGAQSYARFKAVVEAELGAAELLRSNGVRPHEVYAKRVAANYRKLKPRRRWQPPRAVRMPAHLDLYTPTLGSNKALVTVVAFSDLQCPFCARAHRTLHQVRKVYGDKVRIAFRHLPLPFHRYAQLAAEATMAAHAQGKFWVYVDRLFEHRTQLSKADLIAHARALGLDVQRFTKALDTRRYRALVLRDKRIAQLVGARGTPNFFINGQRLTGAQPFFRFKQVIDRELIRAQRFQRRYRVPAELTYAALITEKQGISSALGRLTRVAKGTRFKGVSFGKRNKRTVSVYLDVSAKRHRDLLAALRRQAESGQFQLVAYFVPWSPSNQRVLFANALAAQGDRQLFASDLFERMTAAKEITVTGMSYLMEMAKLKRQSKRLLNRMVRLIKGDYRDKLIAHLASRGVVSNTLPIVVFNKAALAVRDGDRAEEILALLRSVNDLL